MTGVFPFFPIAEQPDYEEALRLIAELQKKNPIEMTPDWILLQRLLQMTMKYEQLQQQKASTPE